MTKLTSMQEYFQNHFSTDIVKTKQAAKRKTGFKYLDENLIFASGLYVLGGLPSVGKTTFAWQMAENLAMQGEKVIFVSYEMSRQELFLKSVARRLYEKNSFTTLTAAKIKQGYSDTDLVQVVDELKSSSSGVYVYEAENEGIDEIISMVKAQMQNNIKPVLMVDYLQIVPVKEFDNKKESVDDTVRKLKLFQRENDLTIIVISSLNRLNYNVPITFEAFKESGGIEYTADCLIGLQLKVIHAVGGKTAFDKGEIFNKAKKQTPRIIELACVKNRNGNIFECDFEYYSANDNFESVSKKDAEKVFKELERLNGNDNSLG